MLLTVLRMALLIGRLRLRSLPFSYAGRVLFNSNTGGID